MELPVSARRRAVVRVGVALLVAATAVACIFDRGGYDGAGRRDTQTGTGTSTSTATATDTTPPGDATPPADGSSGGMDAAGRD